MIDGIYAPEETAKKPKDSGEKARKDYQNMSEKALTQEIKRLEKTMQKHAQNLEFEKAAAARDALFKAKKCLFGVTNVL